MEEHKVAEPHNWFQYIPETTHIAPESPPPPTPDENRNIIEEQAKQLAKSQKDFDDYKETMEARFDKLATMLQALVKTK
jgi:hypothetical protein